jgi:hypothetical protein
MRQLRVGFRLWIGRKVYISMMEDWRESWPIDPKGWQ